MTTTPACAITSPLQLLSVQADQTAPYPLCGGQHPGRICPRIVEFEFHAARDTVKPGADAPGATSGASIYSRKNGKAYQINQAITTYQRR